MADEKDPGTPPASGDESDAPAQSDASAESPSSPDAPEAPENVDEQFDEIVSDAGDGDSDGLDSEGELVGAGVAASNKSAGRAAGDASSGQVPVKKNRATPKQRRAQADQSKRSGPIGFVKGSISELKKVVYPTGAQLGNYFVVVLVFVLIIIGIVMALDAGFGWLVLKVFSQ